MKFAKFLRTTFFTEEYQWLLLMFSSRFQRSSEQTQVELSAVTPDFAEKKYLLPQKSRSSYRKCSVGEGLQGLEQMFSCEYCEIFKKNICERLLLEIGTSVTNLPKGGKSWILFKPYSILNFAMTGWFCYRTCFAKIFCCCFFLSNIIFLSKKFHNTL